MMVTCINVYSLYKCVFLDNFLIFNFITQHGANVENFLLFKFLLNIVYEFSSGDNDERN